MPLVLANVRFRTDYVAKRKNDMLANFLLVGLTGRHAAAAALS
jgi:hypothetical protein